MVISLGISSECQTLRTVPGMSGGQQIVASGRLKSCQRGACCSLITAARGWSRNGCYNCAGDNGVVYGSAKNCNLPSQATEYCTVCIY